MGLATDEVERRAAALPPIDANSSPSSTPAWPNDDAPHDRSNRLLCFQPLVHYQRIDIAFGRMIKGLWQAANRHKTKRIPKSNCAVIGRGYKIELHGFVSQLLCDVLTVLAHRGGQTPPACG